MHAFDVLGDPVRRRVLELLADGERAAGEVGSIVQKEFGISQPAVSQHLRVLRDNGFATVRIDGARRLYAVDPTPLHEVDAWLERYLRFWNQRLDALDTELVAARAARPETANDGRGRPRRELTERLPHRFVDAVDRRDRQVLQRLGGRKRDVRGGDPHDRPVEVPEDLFGDDRSDLGSPTAQAGVLLDRETATGLGHRSRGTPGCRAGTRVRRSMTSAEMPSTASRSAASRARGTIKASATIVQSVPSRTIRASPSFPTTSPSGTWPLVAINDLCSKKTTGSGSLIEAAINPTTSSGVDGATTLRPGIIMHQFSTLWLCCAPKRDPPPLAVRMTIGIVNWPPVMYRLLAISLATRSKQTARKSENMISAITGIPVIAAPMAAPRIACSEIGVSRTRWGPNWSSKPTVVLNTPPGPGNVLTEHHQAGVAPHLLGDAIGNGIAVGQFRHADPPSAQTSVIKTPSVGRSPALANSVASSTRRATSWVMSRQLPLGNPQAEQALVIHRDRVAVHPGFDLAGRSILAGVGPGMSAVAIGDGLDQSRSLPLPGVFDCGPGHDVDGVGVVAIDHDRLESVGRCAPGGRVANRGDEIDRRVLHVEIVLAHEDHRKVPDHCEVQGLVEGSDVGGAVTEEGHCHLIGPPHLGRPGSAVGYAQMGADDGVAAHHPVLDRGEVHRPTLAPEEAVVATEQLGHHRRRGRRRGRWCGRVLGRWRRCSRRVAAPGRSRRRSPPCRARDERCP